MTRFMIEVNHEAKVAACNDAARMLLTTGSHFLTHADWGCLDGVHTAWIVVEAETREEARAILPPLLRPQARVIGLNVFGMDELDELVAVHGGGAAGGVTCDPRPPTRRRPEAYSSSPRLR
jgi:hypothetical protein